ncbi:hypothetical protein CFP56_008109 [Quercus suber]|uniref:Uncharacterized protein n=1 Tax=Quercus suber TaxID=58331 RepID=A0AAW0L6C6_QUESU
MKGKRPMRKTYTHTSSPPQRSLFHLCLPNPPPHHTPELTATEFAGAVLENELRKPILHLGLPKPPPHHTPKLTATEVSGAVRGAWKHTGAAVSHDPKALVDYLPVLLGLVKDGNHLQYKVQFVWVNQEDDAEETGMSNAW